MSRAYESPGIRKAATGVPGLDEITDGGFPAGHPTLICGSAGCGKTIMGISFLVNGAVLYDEPGVFISFEERIPDLIANVKSLGYDLTQLVEEKKIAFDHVMITRGEFEETGEYDLEGLFVRLDYAIRTVNAKRIVIDTIESLFSSFPNQAIMRAELVRLFGWLKDRGMTAIITGERGDGMISRHGLEEYVSDCVILLDHRVNEQVSTRRIRIVKYRGSTHGTNEYPFLIDEGGVTIVPITSLGLDHDVTDERISTGIKRLDVMLKEGIYRGSSVLVSGTAGTGKTSVACHFADAACQRGESAVYFAFEESPSQITRNMHSIGLDLDRWRKKDLLRIEACRPMLHGIEMHLVHMYRMIEELHPRLVVVDPISNLVKAGSLEQASAMMIRLVDYMKSKGITAVFTNLTRGDHGREQTDIGTSSIMDTWILLRDIELGGERNRGMYILKSRGSGHSNQIREFKITPKGIDILEVSLGPEGVLTGSARVAQEARENAQQLERQAEIERRRRELERKRAVFEAQLAQLRTSFETEEEELLHLIQEATNWEEQVKRDRKAMADSRKADGKTRKQVDDGQRVEAGGHTVEFKGLKSWTE